jgi:1-acyl-sn-glycerol-3-phosphate acyltransferase
MIVIILGILFIILVNPVLYSCITWNYSLMAFMGLLGYTNIIAFTVVFLVYMLLPSRITKEILLYFNQRLREVFRDRISETESNIRKTFQIHVREPIPEKSINIWHPHGVSGVTPVIHNGYKITSPEYKPTKGVVHYGYFMLPFIKDIIPLLNAIPSDEFSIRDTLQKESISITIGGIDEMSRVSPKDLQLVVRKRSGIFKIALELGIPIVPVLTYGEQEVFPESEWGILKCYNDFLYKWFRFRFPFPKLDSLVNWTRLSQTPLEPIVTYTGKPVRTKKILNPSSSQIKKLRDLYIQRLQELFDETSPPGYTMTIL